MGKNRTFRRLGVISLALLCLGASSCGGSSEERSDVPPSTDVGSPATSTTATAVSQDDPCERIAPQPLENVPDEVRDWVGGAPVWGQGAIWSAGVNGDAPARENGHLRFKIGWYRTEPGRITLKATLIEATGPGLSVDGEVPDGYGDQGFQATSINLPSAGCWRFTGTLDTQAQPVEFRVQVAA